MAAFMPVCGDPFAAHVSSPEIPWVSTEGDQLRVTNADTVFYHDYPEEDRAEAVAALVGWPLTTRDYVVPTEGIKEAWRTIPATYIMFTDDQALLEPHQDATINRAEANLRGKLGFFFGGLSLPCLVWCYYRIPEMKDRTYEELDIMFERNVPTREFGKYKI